LWHKVYDHLFGPIVQIVNSHSFTTFPGGHSGPKVKTEQAEKKGADKRQLLNSIYQFDPSKKEIQNGL